MNGTRVAVLGAGIVGAACARELARAGMEVTVLDRGRPGAATTSHGEGNVLVSDKGPGPELRLALLSRRLWPDVLAAVAGGSPGGAAAVSAAEWDPKGGVVVATTQAGARRLVAFAEDQRGARVTAEPLTSAELLDAEPFVTSRHTAAVHYPQDAQVQPAGAGAALLHDAVAAGATLRVGTEVVGARTHAGRLTGVHTTRGVIEADLFVNAAGPWAGDLGTILGAPVAVAPRRGDVLVTTPVPPTVFHKVYDADYVGAVESGEEDLRTSAVVESTRAGSILIGSSRRRVGFDQRLCPDVLSAVARTALRLFPALATVPIMRTYGGFRPYVPDHLPIIGADPRLPGLWHATGHEGAGVGLSVGTGRLLRNLVLDEPPETDPTAFRVDRPGVTGCRPDPSKETV